MTRLRSSRINTLTIALAIFGACADGVPAAKAPTDATATQANHPSCPQAKPAPKVLPGVTAEQRTLAYWLKQVGNKHSLDDVVLSPEDIQNLNASYTNPRPDFHPQTDLLEPIQTTQIRQKIKQRFAWLNKKYHSGAYIQKDGSRFTPHTAKEVSLKPTLRVALDSVQVYCAPHTRGIYIADSDRHVDYNRCSTIHPQEAIQVLADWPNGMKLARARYTMGWIQADAALSPPVAKDMASVLVRGPFASVIGGPLTVQIDGKDIPIAEKTRLANNLQGSATEHKAYVATTDGVQLVSVPLKRLRSLLERPLTRRAILEEAFRYLNKPYGFGGAKGGYDCSRLLLNLFESFGIRLPRHSSWQAHAGSFSIPTEGVSEADKLTLLDAAHKSGIVILQLPGHVMLYLGRNQQNEPMVIHALGEYLESCPDNRGETIRRVDRVQVSNLELGTQYDSKGVNRTHHPHHGFWPNPRGTTRWCRGFAGGSAYRETRDV